MSALHTTLGMRSRDDQPYICQLLIDSLFFQLPCSCISEVCDELYETPHVRVVAGAATAQEIACGGRHGEVVLRVVVF
jgi:hypothetical protein